jgi:hypothetical protein
VTTFSRPGAKYGPQPTAVSLSKELAENHSQEILQRAAEIVASSTRLTDTAAGEMNPTELPLALSSHLWTELLD